MSSGQFFSSPWIRQKMTQEPNNHQDFFQVIIPSPLTAWRTQAKLVAAQKSSAWAKDGCTFGLYRQRTHQVESIPNCEVHHPSINRAVAVLEEASRTVGNSAYDEERREGGLRYVQLQVERTTGKICLTFVWNAGTLKETQPALSRLVKQLNQLDNELWHSVWVHCNDSPGNAIFSRNPKRWHKV
jgi:23S rRNA (uracil1939-C5)-methyltransferase